jgi:DNA-3-methyladenine glycosylase II
LIFHLLRPNVFPKDDLGLQKALSLQYKKRYPLGPRQLAQFEKKFQPWSSVATWYLWRSLDPIPVEY